MALDDLIGRLYDAAGVGGTNHEALIDSLFNDSLATSAQTPARVRPLAGPVSVAPQAAPVAQPEPQDAPAPAQAAGGLDFPGKPLDFPGKDVDGAAPQPQAGAKLDFPGKPVEAAPPRVNGTPERMVPLAPPPPVAVTDPWAAQEGDPLAAGPLPVPQPTLAQLQRPELRVPLTTPAEGWPANPVAAPAGTPAIPPPPPEQSPGFGATLGEAAWRGGKEGLQETADAFRAWHDKKTEQDDSYVGKLLQTPMDKGYKSADWWGAQIGYGLAKSSPTFAAALGLGAAGTAAAGPVGGAVGGIVGFGLGSALQEIAPAYQRARADGLSHEDSVNRAWLQSGIAGAFGAAMGAVGGPAGKAAEASVKQKIGQALADIFVKAPLIGAGQQATQAKVEGKDLNWVDIGQGYALNAATGAVMVGGHKLISGADGVARGFSADEGARPTGPAPGEPGGPSSPEDIAEFIRRADATKPPPGPAAERPRTTSEQLTDGLVEAGLTPEHAADFIRGMSPRDQAKALDDMLAGRAAKAKREQDKADRDAAESATSDTLRAAGFTDEEIGKMTPAQRTAEAAKRKPADAPEAPSDAQSPPKNAPNEKAAPKNDYEAANETLRKFGYDDEQIASMTPEQRAAEIAHAQEVAEPLDEPTPRSKDELQRLIRMAEAHLESMTRAAADTSHPQDTRDHYAAQARSLKEGIARYKDELNRAETSSPSNEAAKSDNTRTDQTRAASADNQGASEPGHVAPLDFPGKLVGGRDARVSLEDTDLKHAANAAATDYTPAQGEANNRQLGHARWNGLDLSIETPAGGVRRGVDKATGKTWETRMGAAYGYIRGTKGADGMHIDAFVGTHPDAHDVYVLNENDSRTGKFRQTKTFIGFDSEAAARKAYTDSSSKSEKMIGGVTAMPVDQFKDWLKNHDHRKPAGASVDEIGAMLKAAGVDAARIEQHRAVIDRAAEIQKAKSLPAPEAFEQAVIEKVDAALTPEQFDQAYGKGAHDEVLSAATPEGGLDGARQGAEGAAADHGGTGAEVIRPAGAEHPAGGAEGAKPVPAPAEAESTPATRPPAEERAPGKRQDVAPIWGHSDKHPEWAKNFYGDGREPNIVYSHGPIALMEGFHDDGTSYYNGMKNHGANVGMAAPDIRDYKGSIFAPAELEELQAAAKRLAASAPSTLNLKATEQTTEPRLEGGVSDSKDFNRALDDVLDEVFGKAPAKKKGTPQVDAMPGMAPLGARSKAETAQSAAKNMHEAADAALDGLVELFGGGKTFGSGPAFDEATYAKAKPLFIRAAGKFLDALTDMHDLLRAIVNDLKTRSGFTREVFERMRPYLERFIEEVRAGSIKLGEGAKVEHPKGESDGHQGTVSRGDEGAAAGDVSANAGARADEAGRRGLEGSREDVPATHAGQAEAVEPAGPAGGRGVRESGAAEIPARGDNAAGRAQRAARRQADTVRGENYSIEPGALDEGRSFKVKAQDNVRAIELARAIETEGRPATRAEQEELARYVGWGGIKGAFPDADGKFAKGFEEIGEKLKSLLDPDEYATARRSIQYAHYTAEPVVRAMWQAAQRLGYKGAGQVFEPGMGVGNFAGMMPPDLAATTRYVGLEMDHVTAGIAKLLYPRWGVKRDDFTRSPLPRDTFDLAIGNPPFADVVIKSDPKYAKLGLFLHDYFFAKSLDGVRPGGLLMFISSAGTMNKIDPSARNYLADRAELVGAIRLPGNAFKKNAGTEVTTDIVMLRKRLPDEAPGDRSWTQTVETTLPGPDGTPTKGAMSRYFAEHPEMVLGEQGFFDKLYEGRYAVRARKDQDFAADLAGAINRLPADVMSAWEKAADHTATDFQPTERKDGSFYLKDGKLHQVAGGAGRPVAPRGKGIEGGRTSADIERIKGMVPVKDALRAVFAADLAEDAAGAAKARKDLNRTYDAFVKKFGPINKAEITKRRPSSVQEEAARAEAREEARYNGQYFEEGSFDPSNMIAERATTTAIARARKAAREAALAEGKPWDEGSFDPAEMPDIIIDKRPNFEAFADDPESYRLRAIEHYNDVTGAATKSDVFTRNVISRQKVPEIKSVNDAVLHVLNQRGRLDIAEVAAAAKVTQDQAIEQLGESIFKEPGTDDTWVTRDEYLSGNVRKKLRLAKAAAARDPDLQRNVAALEAAQPIPLGPSQIHATLGMPWIPPATVEQFGKDALGLSKLKATYIPSLASWTVHGDTESAAAVSTFGTARRSATHLIGDVLNRRQIKIYDNFVDASGNKRTELNVAATQSAQDKADAIRQKFSEWVWNEPSRVDHLAGLYNEQYNNLVVRNYDGSYLTTPGITSTWSWRPHQTRGIARIIQSGNTYLAHAVGAGKTSEMIGAGMEMRRLGLVRKPMYAVPNHMLAQFTKEFYEQYPTARIMVADERQFHTDRRKQFVANAALEDLDAIIITHSAFGKIPISDEFSNGVIDAELEHYRKLLENIPTGTENRVTRSRIEKQIERLEQRLSGNANKRADQVFTFEEMGADFLFVDEAHLFRKLDFSTEMGQVKGVSPEGSQMAWDLYVKSLYLDQQRPGRSLVLASGTPVTNTMAELYSLSRYLQRSELEERGLAQFDAWAGAFGEVASELEQDAAGGYKTVARFSKFVNVPELSAMVRNVMDVVTSKQLAQYVVRPTLKDGKRQINLAEKSSALGRYQQGLADRMKKIQERKGPPSKGDDIMLSVINDGRHAAIDMRLVGGSPGKEPSKLDLLVRNVARIFKETTVQPFYGVKDGAYTAEPIDHGPATQMIFANLGLSGTRGFSVPNYIRAELVRLGIPKDQIAFIYDYKTHVAKQKLFNDMNAGKIRVLIGSTAKMATGVNAQRRLAAIHNLDPLWFPSDDEQRNGRGIRQGNMNREIAIHDYATKGTYDSTMWGMMARKARFIEGFFNGDASMRDMEDLGEASQYEQAKAITTNDPRLIRLTELKQDLERARRREASFNQEHYALRQRRQQASNDIGHLATRIEQVKQDIAERQDVAGDKFTATVYGTTYTKRADFGAAVLQRLDKLTHADNIGKQMPLAEIGGFPIIAEFSKSFTTDGGIKTGVFMRTAGNHEWAIKDSESAMGITRSMEATLNHFDVALEHFENKAASERKFLADTLEASKKTFEGRAAIAELAAKVKELEADLAPKPQAEATPARESAPDEQIASALARHVRTEPAAIARRSHLEEGLAAIIQKIVGNRVKVEFPQTIPIGKLWGYGSIKTLDTAAGMFLPADKIIQLAMADPAYPGQERMTAHHEAFHAVEWLLWGRQGRALDLLKREDARLRKTLVGMGYDKESIAQLADHEVRATAYQHYAAEQEGGAKSTGGGIHIAIMRMFQKMLELVRRVRNFLQGHGYRTAEDVFKDVYSGGERRKADIAERNTVEGAGAAIDRGELYSAMPPRVAAATASIRNRIADLFESRSAKNLSEGIYDLSRPVRDLQNELEARRDGTFPDSQDFHTKKRLFPGRRATEIDDFNKNHLDPLIKVMRENNLSLAEGALYAYAKHAPERNAAMDVRNPALNGAGSGMTDEQAQSVMDRAAAEGKTAAYEEMSRHLAGIREFILQTMERGGLEKPEIIQAWREKYEHYVPLRGFEDAREDAPPNYGPPKGFNVRGKEVHPAFGRRSRADNPIVNLIDQAYRTVDRAERNRYLQAFHLAMSSMGPEAADIAVRDKGQPRKEIDPGTGLVRTVDTSPNVMSPNVVSLKIGGNPVHWVFKNRETAEAVKRMSPDALNGFFQGLMTVENKLKAIWTHYSPDFLVRHFLFRYPIEGTLNSFEQKESGEHSVGTYIKNAVPFLGEASRAIFARNKGEEAGEMGRYYDEMRKAGGAMTFRAMRDMDLIREHLQTALMSLSGRPDLTVRQKWRKAIEGMDVVTNALDNSLRLAAYASARKQGKTPQQAALIAREATVDFQLKGKWANTIGLWFPFGNVALQTASRMTKALARSKIMRRVFMGTMLAGFLTSMFNYLVIGKDKDGVPFFDKLPEWDKRLNFIILNPFDKDAKGRPLPIKIPMPYNWAMPLAMGYAFGNMAFGSDGIGKSISLITSAMVESLTPFGAEHNKAVLAAPELARPALHVALNQKFTGSPVHVPAEQANARFGRNVQRGPNSETPWNRPTEEQQVGQGWQMIARGVNAASGGSRTKAGLLDFYPEDYKEILGYVIGTPLRFGQEVTGTASSIIKGEAPKSTNIPFARVFRGADYDAADRARAYEQSQANRKPWLAPH